jgi:hypothetical protein
MNLKLSSPGEIPELSWSLYRFFSNGLWATKIRQIYSVYWFRKIPGSESRKGSILCHWGKIRVHTKGKDWTAPGNAPRIYTFPKLYQKISQITILSLLTVFPGQTLIWITSVTSSRTIQDFFIFIFHTTKEGNSGGRMRISWVDVIIEVLMKAKGNGRSGIGENIMCSDTSISIYK